MSKSREYYNARISRILAESISYAFSSYYFVERHINNLMFGYRKFGIDWLLDMLADDMANGVYYVPVKVWDRIVDYDYLSHHC